MWDVTIYPQPLTLGALAVLLVAVGFLLRLFLLSWLDRVWLDDLAKAMWPGDPEAQEEWRRNYFRTARDKFRPTHLRRAG